MTNHLPCQTSRSASSTRLALGALGFSFGGPLVERLCEDVRPQFSRRATLQPSFNNTRKKAHCMTSDTSDTPNIGFVLYTKSYAPGTLNARWVFSGKYSGPGIATGGPKEGFAGRYHVRYFYDSGAFSDEYDLVIEKIAEFYKVSWLVDGNVLALGVGMEVEEGLAVGWRRVGD